MVSWKILRYITSKIWKGKWLFHATNFQSLMYPCFTFCRILGMFPYNINASIFETSKSQYILSTVVACVCCAFDVLFIYVIIVAKINLGDITKNLEIICYTTFSGFIVVITHILNGPRMRLLQTILEISSKLSSKSYQELSKVIYIKDILGVTFMLVQMCIFFIKISGRKFDYLTVLILAFQIYFYLIVFQLNMLYVNCVCVLKACFKRINDNLAHMQILMTNVKLRSPRLIRRLQRSDLLVTELKILQKWHLTVNDAVKMLNIIFSLQIVATIVMSYSNTTFQMYTYTVRWQDGIFINFDTYFVNAFLTSITYYILNVTLLVWACETGKNQIQEINTTVHDVLNSTNNKQIKNELQLFSLQILHGENKFSAKSFTVDATLLTVIMGNITTYLLILIQFLNASHSCDRRTTNKVV